MANNNLSKIRLLLEVRQFSLCGATTIINEVDGHRCLPVLLISFLDCIVSVAYVYRLGKLLSKTYVHITDKCSGSLDLDHATSIYTEEKTTFKAIGNVCNKNNSNLNYLTEILS